MRILVDLSATRRLRLTTQDNGRWYYCAAAPALAIVRVDGSDLASLTGYVVDAQVGWDGGTPGFVREDNEGRQHTKVTIRRRVEGRQYDGTLSAVLADAPHE
jgi:hypothetical protein